MYDKNILFIYLFIFDVGCMTKILQYKQLSMTHVYLLHLFAQKDLTFPPLVQHKFATFGLVLDSSDNDSDTLSKRQKSSH